MIKKLVTLDPIHGRIEIPSWLREIEKFPCVRRMMFIRQLGLKAYVDFPGAIHTRYSHSLGTMHLAGKVSKQLGEKIESKGETGKQIAKNLEDNRNDLMAAGFLHDIGHGPFSHAVDFALKKIGKKSHEEIAAEIINDELVVLENHGITRPAVQKIIAGKHDYPFISQIINGQLDVDKLDYLLRDAHHIGLRYSFDIDHFVNSYTILGLEENLEKCDLGLDDSTEALVTAEIFILIWKSMYDLVYHVKDSRIAEKMLEKAILRANSENAHFRNNFVTTSKFLTMNDDTLLSKLEREGGFAKSIVQKIRENKLYESAFEFPLKKIQLSGKFMADLEDESTLSDAITLEICNDLKLEDYELICDIVKSRVPKPINLDKYDKDGEPVELGPNSDVISHIKQKINFKVYCNANVSKNHANDDIKKKVKESIASW